MLEIVRKEIMAIVYRGREFTENMKKYTGTVIMNFNPNFKKFMTNTPQKNKTEEKLETIPITKQKQEASTLLE